MPYRVPRIVPTLPFLVAASVAACSSSSYSTSNNNPQAPTADVTIVSGAQAKTTTAYSPDTFTVSLAAGGKVIFGNGDAIAHTATGNADSASFYTGHLPAGSVDTITFTTQGNHPFHCSIHPNMVGLVIVNP
jgi:plastocyanin